MANKADDTQPEKKKAVKKTVAKKTSAKKSTAKKATTTGERAATDSAADAPAKVAAPAAKAPTPKAAKPARLRVRQIRSTIHRPKTFKATLVALGIRHHQAEVVVSDTPSIRGMLKKVHHLIRVTPEES